MTEDERQTLIDRHVDGLLSMEGYEALPRHLAEELVAWALFGRPVGNFLDACLRNDLRGAINQADAESREAIQLVVWAIYNRLPMGCQGSTEKMCRWGEERWADPLTRLPDIRLPLVEVAR